MNITNRARSAACVDLIGVLCIQSEIDPAPDARAYVMTR